MGAKNTVTK